MLVRIYCPGYVDIMKKVTRKQAIEIAKSWVRETHKDVYIYKPLTGFNRGRFRHVCTVNPGDV